MKWPRDNQKDLLKFYGTPGPEVEKQLVSVTPPFRMTYEGKPIKAIRFHRKAAVALEAALNEIWDYYGRDQKKIDALGISKYAGAYNPRKVRGSKNKWSNHAYGAAIDLNAEENGLGKGKGNIPAPVIAAFKRQGARWGGDYKTRTDPMHFEFCDNGESPMAAVGLISDPGVVMAADEEVEAIQKRLVKLGYPVGVVDGKWGGMTAGAIAGFKNDRGLPGEPIIDDALKVGLTKAEKEGFTRPIAKEREEATEKTVAKNAPEIVPVQRSRLAALWATIVSVVLAIANAIADYFQDALSWVSGLKEYASDTPAWIWFAAAAVVALVIWFAARSGASGIVEAFRKGERT